MPLRPTSPFKGPCGDIQEYPELLVPVEEPDEETVRLIPFATQQEIHRNRQGIYDLQRRVCLLENAPQLKAQNVGPITFIPEVNTYGTFTLRDVAVADTQGIVKLHVILVYVNEVKTTLKATTSSAAPDSTADFSDTVTIEGEDEDDPELQFVVGDYLLWNDPAQPADPARGGRKYELGRLVAREENSWTISRHHVDDIRPDRAYFESFLHAHDAGIELYKVQLKHFSRRIEAADVYFNNPQESTTKLGRFDFLWPSRVVCAVQVGVEMDAPRNTRGLTFVSPFAQQYLGPLVYDTTGPEAPPAPGLRTLAGQAYHIPYAAGVADLEAGETLGYGIRVQDLASLRTVYVETRGGHTGASIIVQAKYRPVGDVDWTNLELLTIAVGEVVNWPEDNRPGLRRMPYSLEWPPPILPQDAELNFDLDQVGAGSPGVGLTLTIQT